jgi:8-oxo-dGTP pyrophosphatase MutT (NUDIX family)
MTTTTLSSQEVYSNPWIHVYKDEVRFPDGSTGEYGRIHHTNESVVVAVTNGDSVLVVDTDRYVTGMTSRELPAGGIEAGETPAQAAAREVREETGITVTGCEERFSFYPSNGTSDQTIHVVTATCSSGELSPDGNEVHGASWCPRSDLMAMVTAGGITDGPTMVALFALLLTKDAERG